MPKFRVYLTSTISTVIEVEAETAQQAADHLVWNSPDMPGSMCYGAFGSASVDESGEWNVDTVYDEQGKEVKFW